MQSTVTSTMFGGVLMGGSILVAPVNSEAASGTPAGHAPRRLRIGVEAHVVGARASGNGRVVANLVAAMANERLDGSGYHRGLVGAAIPAGARILAAADAFQAMTEPRPYRPALTAKAATEALRADVRAGRLGSDAVDAVLAAAGQRRGKRRSGPAGLTAREVEVLILIARGAATKQVARALGITPKTAETHVERIYSKIGASTRSTATLFAVQHGLLDSLEPLDL